MQTRLSRDIATSARKQFLTLNIENDLIGAGTDKDYTSGVRLSYLDTGKQPKQIGRYLEALVPAFAVNETTSIAYSLGQNLYTPEDITIAGPQPDERPWAGFLYASAGLATLQNNHVDEVEATLGVVGSLAQGKAVQNAIHELVDARDPEGWDNQIHNEPGVILSWRRRWPKAVQGSFGDLDLSLEPNINLSLGNIYTQAGTGVSLRLSPDGRRWQDTPLRVRPAIPGSGFFQPRQHWAESWYFFSGVQGRAVGRNIFLDGNSFRDSPSVDKKPFVMDVNAGIAFTLGDTRISYTAVYRTKEFDAQDDGTLFGAVSLGYRF